MNKEQQKLLNEAYKNYSKKMMYHPVENWLDDENDEKTYRQLSQEEFINKCKTDLEFSEKWGLAIKEQELSDEERMKTLTKNEQRLIYERVQSFKNVRSKKLKDFLDEQNIPTKLITISYNDKTIESYE
jgi:hypothetical protein